MRVLVPGASGFIGRHAVAALLARGCEVVALARRPGDAASGDSLPGLDWLAGDLLEPGEPARIVAKARADAVLHLAWCVTPGRFWTDPANLDWVGASLRLLRAAAAAGTRRLVFTGTCFEYDWPATDDCREGVTPLAGHTLYDVAKDALHRTAAAFAAQEGFSFAWARLFHLYGPAEDSARLVPQICRALVAGEAARASSGLVLRDFMDARDAGAALAALVTSEVTGPVNVASGEAVTIADIVTRLASLAGRPELARLGALPDRPGEPPRITADVARVRGEVGAPAPRPLQQGLAEALAFWRARAEQGA